MAKDKKEIQSLVKDADAKIQNITQRIGVMQSELSQLNTATETRSQAIQTAMINGADPQKDLETQRSEKAKAEQLTGAIQQAKNILESLEGERGARLSELAMIEILAANDETDRQIVKCFSAIRAAFAEFEKIAPLDEKTRVVSLSHKIYADQLNETHQTRAVSLFLNEFFRDTHHRVLSAEDGHKNYFSAIK